MDEFEAAKLESVLDQIGVAQARRHVFLCLGPDCCAPEEGQVVWDLLKRRLKELAIPVLRTKAGCFRICQGGPWMVVYPDGIWYGQVTPERCERIITEHLQQNRPIAEWITLRHPLPDPSQK